MNDLQLISFISVSCSEFANKHFQFCPLYYRKDMGERTLLVCNVGTCSQGQRCFEFNTYALICIIRDSAIIINYPHFIILLTICKCTFICLLSLYIISFLTVYCLVLLQGPQMMLYIKNSGMPVLDPLLPFHVKGSEFITSHKVTWNRYGHICPPSFSHFILKNLLLLDLFHVSIAAYWILNAYASMLMWTLYSSSCVLLVYLIVIFFVVVTSVSQLSVLFWNIFFISFFVLVLMRMSFFFMYHN